MNGLIDAAPLIGGANRTRERWASFTPEQKRHFVIVNGMDVGRISLRLLLDFAYDQGRINRAPATLAHTALDSVDLLNGHYARKWGVVSEFGEEWDPFADKVDSALQESRRVKRGTLNPRTARIRLARDVASTIIRSKAQAEKCDSNSLSAAASKWGKGSSFFRIAANRTADALPGTRTARVLEHAATLGLVVSGCMNYRDYLRNKRAGKK
jgi:phosphatidylglycerophosphate synthase